MSSEGKEETGEVYIGKERRTCLDYVEELKAQLYSFVEAMAAAIDERTPYNGFHTRKVAEYAGLLADYIEKLHQQGKCEESFDANRREKLILAALLHDVGKMVVPLSVMNRATRLGEDMIRIEERFELLRSYYEIDMLRGRITEREYESVMREMDEDLAFIHQIDQMGHLDDETCERVCRLAGKKHVKPDGTLTPYITKHEADCMRIREGTLTGEDRLQMEYHVVMTEKILSKVRFQKDYTMVPKFAAAHHEFLDGSGYPRHLKGEQLDLETRILTIADIYEALTAKSRPYKKPMPKEKALRILKGMAEDGKLDKQLVCWLKEALG